MGGGGVVRAAGLISAAGTLGLTAIVFAKLMRLDSLGGAGRVGGGGGWAADGLGGIVGAPAGFIGRGCLTAEAVAVGETGGLGKLGMGGGVGGG